MENVKIISGNSNKILAEDICNYISYKHDYCCEPTDILLDKFSDGEIRIQINENLRGCHVFVIQSLSYPVNDNIIELCLILDTLKRCNVDEVTVVTPFLAYSRQDKKDRPRTPLSAKVIADILQVCGLNRIVAIDLHSPQIQGFFNCPVDNLYGSKVLLEYMNRDSKNLVIVSPDAGGIERAIYCSKKLNCGLAYCYKHRDKPNEIAEMRLIGDVKEKKCILIDDMIDTGNSLIKSANILKDNECKNVEVFATHGIFSGESIENLSNSCIDTINITNTINLPNKVLKNNKFNVISVAEMVADVILNIFEKKSVSSLFL